MTGRERAIVSIVFLAFTAYVVALALGLIDTIPSDPGNRWP